MATAIVFKQTAKFQAKRVNSGITHQGFGQKGSATHSTNSQTLYLLPLELGSLICFLNPWQFVMNVPKPVSSSQSIFKLIYIIQLNHHSIVHQGQRKQQGIKLPGHIKSCISNINVICWWKYFANILKSKFASGFSIDIQDPTGLWIVWIVTL